LTGEQRPQSVYREIMWGNIKKSGLYTTHPKHYNERFRGSNWHWYDVNDCWYFADNWIGKPVKTDIYGGGDMAEFILNGKSQGKVPFEKLIASMDIEYQPGILEAIVYKEEKVLSRCRLVTPGKAEKLDLRAEDTCIHADGKDLAYIRVIITDVNGRRLTHDEREISIEISGEGILLAAGSGNPCTTDHITANTCHLYRGTAILIVKSNKVGRIEVTVSADGVEDGTCVLDVIT